MKSLALLLVSLTVTGCHSSRLVDLAPVSARTCYKVRNVNANPSRHHTVFVMEPGKDSGSAFAIDSLPIAFDVFPLGSPPRPAPTIAWVLGFWRGRGKAVTLSLGHTIVETITLVARGDSLQGTSLWYSDFIMVGQPNVPYRDSFSLTHVTCRW